MVNKLITFHPYADFKETFKVLDYRRLGKQRQEALQILKALLGLANHYKSQAAAKAWKGYESTLCIYGALCCDEWKQRGYIDNTKSIFEAIYYKYLKNEPVIYPRWIGYEPYHSNQRARLLAKNYIHYSQFKWEEEPTDTYEFPTHLYGV